jgi:hypothetical protein
MSGVRTDVPPAEGVAAEARPQATRVGEATNIPFT